MSGARDCSVTHKWFPCRSVNLFVWFWQIQTNKRMDKSFDSSIWFSSKTGKDDRTD